MKTIRTAVVGVGHQGRWHAEKFAALEASHLVAVVDADTERCGSVASHLGVGAVGEVRNLIGAVDAVSIATPTPSHFDIASTLLDNGIHVLLEKPLTATVDEARDLVDLAERRNLILQVGHLERFNPSVMALTPYVQEPQFIESTRIAPYKRRGLDVSVVLDLMIHDIDLIHSFVRSPMSSVDATGRSIFSDNVDIANARIRFDNGCIANVTSSRISLKTERMLRIFQANAYLSADLYGKRSTIYRKQSDGPVDSPEDIGIVKLPCEDGDALLAQSEAFLDSVAGGPPPLVDGRIAIQAMETAAVINDMIHAARTA
jgi:predicted dehydrogenase